ncbi:hypothetical protein [Catellatospora chokoriensis]|uniref:Uncharacterized protein n=1 Tax=Catellatospora chokoriensis TaxID=310353 RepID=A0A8J3NPQ7_9ACTN|nr:hypothetical protein [Catellatospora chokoriensis]GIF88165.1 hypothetical protein Cch02nite_16090 [Catellatospora chokoriensis]
MLEDILTFVGTLAVVVSLLFLAVQTRAAARQAEINNSIGITSTFYQSASLVQVVHGTFLSDPSLRAYFYDGRECSPKNPQRAKVVTLAELHADALEYGLMAGQQIKGAVAWVNYPRDLLARSPVMQEVVSGQPELWPRLADLLADIRSQKAS